MKKGLVLVVLLLSAAFVFAGGNGEKSEAEKFPQGNIQLIVPYNAGGGTDTAARIIGDGLSKYLDTGVVVVNKPGAAGEIGTTAIQNSKPDGYTIGALGAMDNFVQPRLKETSYDLSKMDHIALYNFNPVCIIAKKGGFKTLEEMAAYGKANPGKIKIGVSGEAVKVGGLIAMDAGDFEATTVMFTGGAKSMAALLGGHVDVAVLTAAYIPKTVPEGCTPLAFFTADRVADYPDIPTYAESGYKVDYAFTIMFVLPKGISEDKKKILIDAFDKVGADPDIRKKIEATKSVFKYTAGADLEKWEDNTTKLFDKLFVKFKDQF